MDSLELRVVEVKSALDVGMTEIKGALALLVQGAETDRKNLASQEDRIKTEFARLAAERVAERTAQSQKDADQEARLRSVERKAYTVSGAAGAISLAVLIAHFVH